jgi:hypothetical protein
MCRRGRLFSGLSLLTDTDVTFVLTNGYNGGGIPSEPGHAGRYRWH